jgi:hypothetical protein
MGYRWQRRPVWRLEFHYRRAVLAEFNRVRLSWGDFIPALGRVH